MKAVSNRADSHAKTARHTIHAANIINKIYFATFPRNIIKTNKIKEFVKKIYITHKLPPPSFCPPARNSNYESCIPFLIGTKKVRPKQCFGAGFLLVSIIKLCWLDQGPVNYAGGISLFLNENYVGDFPESV